MSDDAFPPRAHLTAVVRALVEKLPTQLGALLAAPQFAEDAPVLQRLADPARLEAAVAALAPEEAARLAELLLARWARVGAVALPASIAIVAPEEVWIGSAPVRLPITLTTRGLEDWDAAWEGAIAPGAQGANATLIVTPPDGKRAHAATVRVRVHGRASGERVLLVASAKVRARHPHVIVSEDRKLFLVRDQEEQPGVGVRLHVGDVEHVTRTGGLVELSAPAPGGVALRVEGLAAGRVPTEGAR